MPDTPTVVVKNFDEQRALRGKGNRKFQIGGEVFTRRSSVRPEAVAGWEEIGKRGSEMGSEEVLETMDQVICNLIEPGPQNRDHKKWRKIRSREEDPITLDDMIELITWITEDMTGRPTQQSEPSSEAPEPTGTSSTDDSSSPDLKAVSVG